MSGWDQPAQPSQPSNVSPRQADDDDGWGDFEVAEPTGQATAAPVSAQTKVNALPPDVKSSAWNSYSAFDSQPPQIQHNARQTPTTAPTTNFMGGGLGDIGGFGDQEYQIPQPEPKRKSQLKTTPADPNVLFDAEDFELGGDGEDDDEFDEFGEFGDFEAVEQTTRSKPTPVTASQLTQSLDLLGFDDPPLASPPNETELKAKNKETHPAPNPLSFGAMSSSKTQPTESSARQQQPASTVPGIKKSEPVSMHKAKSGSVSLSSTKKKASVTRAISAKASANDDEWGAWDDFPEGNGGNSIGQTSNSTEGTDSWGWDTGDDSKPNAVAIDDSSPPPTNIPPPSILLSAFPELFNTGNALFKPVAGQSTSVKQKVLSNPKAVQFLNGYVLLATTAARVIAGRKHRWHRDKILAKSMSISAAGSKGMKLAGVDKQQAAREDREAADVVSAWREHVGRLRSAVAAANGAGKTSLKVPELTENPQIQTAKMVPTAPKPCIICGLKREERVAKVDLDIEDSFGEWWVDHWGHRACKNFWVEHEQHLRQR